MKNRWQTRLGGWAVVSLGMLKLADNCPAQEGRQDSLSGEAAAKGRVRAAVPERYNIRLGGGGLSIGVGLRGEYIDNVYFSKAGERDDFIFVPEAEVGGFFPIGQLNAFSFDVGLAYYHYFKNTELNTGRPLVNPDSELSFNIYSGDVAIRVSEAFSYQETPFYEHGGQFYNVYNTGLFARYNNRVGAAATWDLQDLVVTGSFYHENFFSNESEYEYINRALELFNAGVMLSIAPAITVGVEGAGSLVSFANKDLDDHWRAAFGPAARLALTEFVKVRLGAGYERIQYDSRGAGAVGLDGFNTFYTYAGVEHEINRVFSHSLTVSHDNDVGINAPNLEGTHVSYSLTWRANEHLRVTPYGAYHWYEESYGTGPGGLYDESFDYAGAGLEARYDLNARWGFGAQYDFRWKDSDVAAYGYTQNRVVLTVKHQF